MSRRYRIVCIADSLALPRIVDDEVVRFHETWPIQLQERMRRAGTDVEVVVNGRRKRTARYLAGEAYFEDVECLEPNALVLQIGVVDCAPRVFSMRQNAILNHRLFPSALRDEMLEFVKHHRREAMGTHPLGRVYTKPRTFEKAYRDFIGRVKSAGSERSEIDVFVLPIVGDFVRLDDKSPGFSSNARLFNGLLRSITIETGTHFVDVSTLARDDFCRDHYHLSASGNAQMAAAVERSVVERLNRSPHRS